MNSDISSKRVDWAPVVVFAYNRPDKLAAMMKSLTACVGFPESQITIFVDGPKSEKDKSSVGEVRDFVRQLSLPNVNWSFRESNIGLRKSIFDGVTSVIKEYGRAIVLEDDLIVSPVTLEYFNQGLNEYASVERVWSIAGYIYDLQPLQKATGAVVLPFAHPWGWATWSRVWDRFDLDNRPTEPELHAGVFKSAFDMNGLFPFAAQLKSSIEGQVDSWFIHWYYTIFRNGGVSVFPPRRLVENGGITDGTHGGKLNPFYTLVGRPELLTVVPEFFDEPNVDWVTLDALKHCRELRVQRLIARVGLAKRRLKSTKGRRN